jgi:putative flippase GtrA
MTSPGLIARAIPNPRVREILTFLFVGGSAFIVDFTVFNGLLLLDVGVITAKVSSIVISTAASYLGNRYLTFSDQKTQNVLREIIAFAAANAVAGAAALLCLAFSHYLLGLTSVLADNLSGNVIGVLLGMAVRYWLYRAIVFRKGASS